MTRRHDFAEAMEGGVNEMQGDPVIDKLMQPVITALMRHGIKGDAKTDIYNRAYEAIMNSMDVMDTMREMLQNMTPEQLQRGAEIYDLLVQAVKDDEKYQAMTNAELAKELLSVWAEVPMFGKVSNLLDEVIMRLGGIREEK